MRKMMEVMASFLGLIGLVVTLIGHMNDTYTKNDKFEALEEIVYKNAELRALEKRVKKNEESITSLEEKNKGLGAIMCGIAIDLKLPTARKECNNIIQNQ